MTLAEKRDKYLQLGHAIQTGVAYKMEADPADTTPKHLRVGINMAMVEHSALVNVLIAKGIITEDEIFDAYLAQLEIEKASYETWLNNHYGADGRIKLG